MQLFCCYGSITTVDAFSVHVVPSLTRDGKCIYIYIHHSSCTVPFVKGSSLALLEPLYLGVAHPVNRGLGPGTYFVIALLALSC